MADPLGVKPRRAARPRPEDPLVHFLGELETQRQEVLGVPGAVVSWGTVQWVPRIPHMPGRASPLGARAVLASHM